MTDIDDAFASLSGLNGRKLKGRGRPRKGCTDVTYKELGLTRQQVYEWRKLSEIPEAEHERFLDECRRQGKVVTRRGTLVHFGKRNNVVTDDIFVGTIFGDLAEQILGGFERLASEMTPKQRRFLARALKYRIREICVLAEMNDESAPKKRNTMRQERPPEDVPMCSIPENPF